MQFHRVNNKEPQHSLVVSSLVYARVGIPCAFHSRHSCVCFGRELSVLFGVAAHRPRSFPHPFPPSFLCLFSVMGACFPSCVGAHGWVIRIFQPWEHTPYRSWLPIVKLLTFFSHLILLCIFSLSSVFFNMSLWQTLPTSSTLNIKLFYSIPRCLGHPTSTW